MSENKSDIILIESFK